MNAPIRRLGTVVALMFCALLIASTTIQFVQAKSLAAKPGNTRTRIATFTRDRGSILVGGQAVAESKPTDDEFKYQRRYLQGPLYAPLTGYYSYWYGSAAVERAYNDLLAGTSDELFYRRFADVVSGSSPQGASVELTVDAKVQQAAAKALGNQRGAVVALDPSTGAILAMVTNPSYDPNALAGHDPKVVQRNWSNLIGRSDDPLVNRAIGGDLYPPGSTFKLVVSAAALTKGPYKPDTVLDGPPRYKVPGASNYYLPNDDGQACGPGDKVNFTRALAVSCNTAYAKLAEDLGAEALRAQAAKFGFGQPMTVPMRVTPSVFPPSLTQPQLAQASIGQFDVRVTPLQVAMISAGIANGGKVMRPYSVKTVRDADLDVIKTTDPSQLSTATSPEVAKQLTTMMEAVVDEGTGTRAQIPGVKVAGKTGTAQHGKGLNPHTWFTGFAPADKPKVAVAVVVEDGGNLGRYSSGGLVAAPIARQVMEAVIKR